MEYKPVELFGGAMQCKVPVCMVDISDFRQVPDNQEVYSDASTGATLVVELLSREREVADADAGKFFYAQLARDNACDMKNVTSFTTSLLPPSTYPHLAQLSSGVAADSGRVCAYASLTTGVMKICKYNETGRENDVLVGLAVLRFLPLISTEVLVSISVPVRIHPESSDAKMVERLMTEEEAALMLQEAVGSLEIKDWGLFVAEP